MGTEEGFTPRAVKGTISDVTVTGQEADLEGFDLETAVTTTVPGDLPVTIPSADTMAMPASPEVHVTDLSATFCGVTIAVSFTVRFTFTEVSGGEIATPSTAAAVTVTVQRADLSGFDLEATVTVAVPSDLPVTIPSADTVGRLSSLEVHVNDLSVAFSGATPPPSCGGAPVAPPPPPPPPPSARRVTPSTATVTVTVQRADLSGFEWEAAVMIAVPADLPVTTPSVTVAMLLSLEFHVRDLSAAFSGVTVVFSGTVAPAATEAVAGETVTPSTATGSSFFLQEEIRSRVTEETRSRAAKAISKFFIAVCLKVKRH